MERSSEQNEKLPTNSLENSTTGFLQENLSRLWSSMVIDELIHQGLDHFYISPGMRNAPLIAAVQYHPAAHSFNGIDERALAYRALGYAKATGKAGVLICTSGTALANYMPAIIEADKSGLPMMVISADRPIELTSSDANQTIDQNHFYGNHVGSFLNLGTPSENISINALRTSIANMANNTRFPYPSPVHINFPFRGPLDKSKEEITEQYLINAKNSFAKKRSKTIYINSELSPNENSLNEVYDLLDSAKAPLLVIGSLSPHEDYTELEKLLVQYRGAFYLDVSSSFKYKFCLNDNAVPTFDHPEVYQYFTDNPPDLIVHIGGRLVSKFYYQLLESNDQIKLITINNRTHKEDPAHSTDIRIIADPNLVAKSWNSKDAQLKEINNNSLWKNFVQKKIDLIDNAPMSYPVLSKAVIDMMPEDSILYLGNSTVVRSFDSYASLTIQKNAKVLTNRGASGIEGFVASAAGYRDFSDKPLTLVIGDISLLHDLNSLHLLRDLKRPITIILANNYGGGIFTLLPVNEEEKLIQQLTTPHNIEFSNIAKQFDLEYKKVLEPKELKDAYLKSFEAKKCTLIEAIIDNNVNKELYNQLKTVRL